MKKKCKHPGCAEIVKGRADRKFCSEYCKTDYHYQIRKESDQTYFKKTVDDVIRTNRRILKEYNQAGKAWVRKADLLNEGFNPRFFTHYWKNNKNETYLFCYDQGFMEITDRGKNKYLLIQWQEYMSQQVF